MKAQGVPTLAKIPYVQTVPSRSLNSQISTAVPTRPEILGSIYIYIYNVDR